MKKYAAFLVAFTLAATLSAQQFQFVRYDSIPVFINTQQLQFPWAGGMNFCQYSDIDLNLDGKKDLFIFDRSGNKITTYLNNGTPNQVDYVLAPQYAKQFPILHDWVLMRDYNCDGKADIFTSSGTIIPGITVWKNISTSAGLQFQLVTSPLEADMTPNSTDSLHPIFVTPVDIPAIRDVDHDGDLDVLTYESGGVRVEFYRNLSEENGWSCDSLTFTLESMCWGMFAENTLNASLTLNDSCGPPPIHPHEVTDEDHSVQHSLHNGSCLECINTDGDADQDIIIGDLANVHVTYGRNGRDTSIAKVDQTDTQYPSYDQSVNMNLFPCGYHVDVDNDGKKDLIFSPNAPNLSENFNSSWLYHNNGADDSVRVSLVKKNFMQDEMIETGEGAYPRFFDYDNDGDQDLFIGNYGYYNSAGPFTASISLYKNTGSATSPAYKLITRDFALLDSLNLNIVTPVPTFGDLDGDGDKDMLVGDGLGRLSFFRKDPGPADNFVFVQGNYQSIDVGNYATPQLVDVDRDGKQDLLIGEQNGNINYYHNAGTSTSPNFQLITPLFGNVIVTQAGFTTGYSVPCLWDNNGAYVLLVGSERGFLFRFDNIDGNLAGNFTQSDSLYVSRWEGGRIAPWVANINGDTLADLIIGNYAGGVSIFKGDIASGVEEISSASFIDVYPNPATGSFTIRTSLPATEFPATFLLRDITGRVVLQQSLTATETTIDCSALPAGVYVASVTSRNGKTAHLKMIIRH